MSWILRKVSLINTKQGFIYYYGYWAKGPYCDNVIEGCLSMPTI